MKLSNERFVSSLQCLFDPSHDLEQETSLSEISNAFSELIGHFLAGMADPSLPRIVRIDPVKLALMLKRFHRDAFEINRFTGWILQADPKLLNHDLGQEILQRVSKLGVRINTVHPRKTRIVAAFSLWMSTLRPIYIDDNDQFRSLQASGMIDLPRLCRLEAMLNFLLATSYLRLFGEVLIGHDNDPYDRQVRLRRIWHDFTYRDLTLSSLEFFYMGVFRPLLQNKVTSSDAEHRL